MFGKGRMEGKMHGRWVGRLANGDVKELIYERRATGPIMAQSDFRIIAIMLPVSQRASIPHILPKTTA